MVGEKRAVLFILNNRWLPATKEAIITWHRRDSSQSPLSLTPAKLLYVPISHTFISLQSSSMNLFPSTSVEYGGLGSLHCSCYFSNYIDIKLFFLLLCTGVVQKASPGFTGLTCFNSSISSPPEAIKHPNVQSFAIFDWTLKCWRVKVS